MNFVPVKSETQHSILIVHRRRRQIANVHTRTFNQIRCCLAEFGVVIAEGVNTLKREWLQCRMENSDQVPLLSWDDIDDLYSQLLAMHQ